MTGISVILIIFLILSLLVNFVLIFRKSSGKFWKELDAYLERNIKGRVSLASPFSHTGHADRAQKEISSRLDRFVQKLRGPFKNVFVLGFSLTTTSDTMKDSSKKLLKMSDETSFQSAQVASAMEEMSATVTEIARSASDAAISSDKTMHNAGGAADDINENVRSIEHLSDNVALWAETNRALSNATLKIDEIILTINDIADQTNLLALNAAIEAARAGEHGRGFAIVADEVRKLADKTAKATDEIAIMIKDVKTKADTSMETMDSTLQGVKESIERSKHADGSLKKIVSEVKQITDMIHQIATAAEEQSKVAGDVLENMEKVSGYAAETKTLSANISASGDSIASVSLKLYNQLCSVKIDALDESMEERLNAYAAHFTSVLNNAVQSGKVNREELFDEAYRKAGEEGKLTTKFTGFFESEILRLLKEWTAADKKIIYVVTMDRNGYMPTHILPARAGIKMDDPISLTGAKSDTIIGQAFRRPIAAGGELVVDIACPVNIEGRHWGCLRMGYLPEMG